MDKGDAVAGQLGHHRRECTDGGGVSRYDGKSFTTYTTAQGLANNSVLSIAEDKSGNLWFGTDGGGVSRYDGKSFTTYTSAQGLANSIVRSIFEDKSGNLWFGTNRGFRVLKSFTGPNKSGRHAKRIKTHRKSPCKT